MSIDYSAIVIYGAKKKVELDGETCNAYEMYPNLDTVTLGYDEEEYAIVGKIATMVDDSWEPQKLMKLTVDEEIKTRELVDEPYQYWLTLRIL